MIKKKILISPTQPWLDAWSLYKSTSDFFFAIKKTSSDNCLWHASFIIGYWGILIVKCNSLIFSSSGSGRITFNNQKSFLEAVRSGFIEIETPKFVKKASVAIWCSIYAFNKLGNTNLQIFLFTLGSAVDHFYLLTKQNKALSQQFFLNMFFCP